jgi:WD40 repeat protein
LILLALATGLVSAASEAAPPITAAAFAPGGAEVVVGSQAGLAVFSWPDLKPLRTIPTRLSHVHDLSFSPDGQVLAGVGGAAAEEGAIEWIEWPGGKVARRESPHQDLIHAVAWRSDSAALVTAAADRGLKILSTQGTVLRDLSGHSRGVLAAAFLNDRWIASAGRDQSLRLWDAETGQVLRSLDNHTDAVVGLAVRPGLPTSAPPWLATIGTDRTLRLWQPTIGRLVRFARLESDPLAVAWTCDGRRAVVSGADGQLRVFDPETAELLAKIPTLEGWAYTLARAPASDEFLVAGQAGQLRRVDLVLRP